jgi:hypothetical protein
MSYSPSDPFIRVGGSWVSPSAIDVRVAGSWQAAQEGFIRVNNQWSRFWPPRSPQETNTFTATATHKWHDLSDGWVGWDGVFGTAPEQGAHANPGNHRGLWFYNSASWRSALGSDGGRVVTKLEIFLERVGTGHMGWGSTGRVRPRLWHHRYDSRPGTAGPNGNGRPALYGGPFLGAALDRGESRWMDLPAAWGRGMADGTIRGFAVFCPELGPVSGYQSRSVSSVTGQIRITHQ